MKIAAGTNPTPPNARPPAVGAPVVDGVTCNQSGQVVLVHSWFMGNHISVPTPARSAELSPVFCDTIQAPEVGQQALDNDDAWLASYTAHDMLRFDSGWFLCESLAFSAALHHKNIRFRDFALTHGRFVRTVADLAALRGIWDAHHTCSGSEPSHSASANHQ